MRSKNSRRCRLFLAVLGCALVLSGCGGASSARESVQLPQTPILSSGPKWAVVEESYVRLFAEASLQAEVVGYDRQGSVLAVESQTNYREDVKGREDHWYLLEGQIATGWVFGAQLKLFDSRDRAENAATLYDR